MGEMANHYMESDIQTYDPNPGHIEMPGGWCIPASQAPEPFRFPRIPRGGIKYPTPPKDTHTMSDTDNEVLTAAIELRKKLDEQIKALQTQLQQRRYPKVPAMSAGHMFGVNIKFQPRGTVYRFLILRTPAKGWYTTGQGDTGHFEDWTALIDWLRGPDVHWHGAIYQLQETGVTVMPAETN